MFGEAPNMNTNPLPNHATYGGTVNVLKTTGSRTLKVFIDEINEMLIKARYKKSSCKNKMMNKSFCKYH
jgi:hypothetical protein